MYTLQFSEKFLEIIRGHSLEPQHKYKYPETEGMEYGWRHKPLVSLLRVSIFQSQNKTIPQHYSFEMKQLSEKQKNYQFNRIINPIKSAQIVK